MLFGTMMRRGFSLMEVMIAVGLLATLLIPVLIFNQRGVVEAGVTQEELLGRQLLMDLCERYKAASPDELAALANPAQLERDDLLIPLRVAPTGMRFARSVTLERNVGGQVGLHAVTFTVAWSSRQRKPQVASLVRLIHWH